MQTQARPMTRDEVIDAARQQVHRLRHEAILAAGRWLVQAVRRVFARRAA